MTVVIFIHGIGGRRENYDPTYQKIQRIIKNIKPQFEVKPCLWGDAYGAKLLANGASIPDYQETGGTKDKTEEELREETWQELYKDPFWEIRLLGYRADADIEWKDKEKPSDTIDRFIEQLADSEFKTQMEQNEIYQFLGQACQSVIELDIYDRWLETISYPLNKEYSAFARMIVAISIKWLNELNLSAPILWDIDIRNKAVDCIVKVLTKDTQPKALGLEWINKFLEDKATSIQKIVGIISGGVADHSITSYMRKRRGAITDFAYPMAGDILVYQYHERGQKIRHLIQHQIESQKQPVILLAHSLGGVACVELLAEKLRESKKFSQDAPFSQVKLLVTVGSQAPFLYELNALKGFPFGEDLPEGFPQWLNIYDLNDVLSYIGGKIFPGRVTDVPVGNKKPFLESHLLKAHDGYWDNESTWAAIFDTWKTIEELQ